MATFTPHKCRSTVAFWLRSCSSSHPTSPEMPSRFIFCSATPATVDADVKRALEIAERSRSSWAVEATDFYPPPVVAEVQRTTKLWSDISVQSWGGYAQAERCRLLFGREEIMHTPPADSSTVAAVNVRSHGHPAAPCPRSVLKLHSARGQCVKQLWPRFVAHGCASEQKRELRKHGHPK